MDINGKSVDMDMNMDGKSYVYGKPGGKAALLSLVGCGQCWPCDANAMIARDDT